MPTLFTIETSQMRLVWSQPKEPPTVPQAAESVMGLAVYPLGPEGVPIVETQADAGLFEQTGYTVFVQSRTDAPIAIRHRDSVLVRGLHRSDGGRVLHGSVNFGAQIGRSRFVVTVGGRAHIEFTVEVFPTKLDYRTDYAALRDDVEAIATELAFAYLRATVQPARARLLPAPRAVAFVTLLGFVMDDLEQALQHIARHPLWGTARARQDQRAERIARPDAIFRRAVAQGRGRGPWQRVAGWPVREHLPARRAHYTLDTPAHRWLAAQVDQLHNRLATLHTAEARRPGGLRRVAVLQALEALQRRVVRLRQSAPLQVAEGTPPPQPPLALLTAPGYREAYHVCLLLRQGLSLAGGPLELGLKDLHVLYEYWCFLTLVRLTARVAGHPLPVSQLLRVERHGLRLRLRKGRAQTITFDLTEGRRVRLTYNPRFGGPGYLVPQQPDFVLTLDQPHGPRARFILDAKYRLDTSPDYRHRYGVPGPPTDALNTLHRYRDAILDRTAMRDEGTLPPRDGRTVVQAVALFPYREETPGAFAASRHGHLLREVGVGAIPLLPGATTYLEAWLVDALMR